MKIRRALYLTGFVAMLLMVAPALHAQQSDLLRRIVHFEDASGTIYQLLTRLSEKCSANFVYDSEKIDNNAPAHINRGDYSVAEAIRVIVNKRNIEAQILGNHVLLYDQENDTHAPLSPPLPAVDTLRNFVIKGRVIDNVTQHPIAFTSVGVEKFPIGTVTNENGAFRLSLPDSLRDRRILFSHLGYEMLAVDPTKGNPDSLNVVLYQKVFPLQEVVIRMVNPMRLLEMMNDNIRRNYPQKPCYLTSFYREGLKKNEDLVTYSEAVFQVYKTAYPSLSSDQVKLLKMRQISNMAERDTLITRMKSGIEACLQLDLIKHLPDFLTPFNESIYRYSSEDMTVYEGRLVNVIHFEPRDGAVPLVYSGHIYIDVDNGALLHIDFYIPDKYMRQSAPMLVVRKSRSLNVTPRSVKYSVSYRNWNGRYYINHLRGDLSFRIRQRFHLFSSVNLNTWFEMATCRVDTADVTRFPRREVLPTRSIFSDTPFVYDESFWNDLNVILPEKDLNEALGKISEKLISILKKED